jgi:hypothetical protein
MADSRREREGHVYTELIGMEIHGDGAVSEVIRPAAIVPEEAARRILTALKSHSIDNGGHWVATTRQWARYNQPGVNADGAAAGHLIGWIEAVYGASTRYEVTLYRVTITPVGTDSGWTVDTLCDEPLGYGGLTLASCPRAQMQPPPKPFRAMRGPDLTYLAGS